MTTYAEISEEYPNECRPWLDRDIIDESSLTKDQLSWRNDGILVKEKLLPKSVIGKYYNLRNKVLLANGWPDPCPYMRHDILKDIALHPLIMETMQSLIGHPMGLHLNLTGWVSTQRDWHSDDYLNPHFVYSHNVAVWIALEDISINSGPFEYVRGSHRWPPLRQDKLFTKISEEEAKNPDWPWTTKGIVVNACETEITRRGAKVEKYLPSKGDVMFWHGRLLHRGSKPTVPGTSRKSLISHYSSINHRPDFAVQAIYKKTGGHYFYVEQYINPSLDVGVMKNKSLNKITTSLERN